MKSLPFVRSFRLAQDNRSAGYSFPSARERTGLPSRTADIWQLMPALLFPNVDLTSRQVCPPSVLVASTTVPPKTDVLRKNSLRLPSGISTGAASLSP